MLVREIIKEYATQGATQAGNIASVANPKMAYHKLHKRKTRMEQLKTH